MIESLRERVFPGRYRDDDRRTMVKHYESYLVFVPTHPTARTLCLLLTHAHA